MSNDSNESTEDEIQTWFDATLQSGYITRLDIDLFHDAVVIEFRVTYGDTPEFHQGRFDGMRSVYYKGGRRVWPVEEGEPEEWEIREGVVGTIEWAYGLYHQPGSFKVSVSALTNWPASELDSTPNFALSLMGGNGMLLIEANRLTLDGKAYEVGYADDKAEGE